MPRLLAAVTLSVLLVAAPAGAQQTNAPPGNSGVDQYLETVPGAGGNHPGNKHRKPVLPAGVRKQLGANGRDGQRLEALANASAPRPARKRRGHGKEKPATGPSTADRGDSRLRSAARVVTDAGGSDGMGILLPLLLGGSTLLLLGAAVLRRRCAG